MAESSGVTGVVALDVNETLSDMSALAPRLEEVGALRELLSTWFAATLRDGFALTAAGAYADFATVAKAALRALLVVHPSPGGDPDEAAAWIVSALGELPLHPDVRPGLERLHDAGIRLVTLTNGSAATSRQLLERGGIEGLIEHHLSVEQVRLWKPAPEPYLLAAERCGVRPKQVMLAAVHPWDVDGAKRAGLAAAWIDRAGSAYPNFFQSPDLACPGFPALAGALA